MKKFAHEILLCSTRAVELKSSRLTQSHVYLRLCCIFVVFVVAVTVVFIGVVVTVCL